MGDMRNGKDVLFGMDRRRFIVSGTGAISAMRVFAAEPACTLVAEQEEGPYYVRSAKLRRLLTEDKTGVRLRFRVRVVNARSAHRCRRRHSTSGIVTPRASIPGSRQWDRASDPGDRVDRRQKDSGRRRTGSNPGAAAGLANGRSMRRDFSAESR